jgi:hypothetical protein
MSQDKSSKPERAQSAQVKSSEAAGVSSYTDFRKSRRNILITLVFSAIGFLTIPNLLVLPYSSLDCSWLIGLNMAKVSGLQFGRDIVIPFGPLGFMYHPLYCDFNTWLISSAGCLFAHCLLIFSVILIIKKLSIPPIDCILMGLAVMLALPHTNIDYKLLFSILILLYLSMVSSFKSKPNLILYIFVSFIMAAVSLLKFNAMLIIVSILIVTAVLHIYKKQIIPICCMLFTYIVSILILLAATGQKISNFPAYLLNSYRLSDGYSSAMAVDGPFWEVFTGLCIAGLFFFLLLNATIKHKSALEYFTFLNLGFVFVSFKHGLVRQDASHIYSFFANALLVFCFMYITNKKQLTLPIRSVILILVFVLGVSIFEYSPRQMIPDIGGQLKMLGSAVSLATDNAAGRDKILEETKSEMRKAWPFKDTTLQYIGGKSVDIMPMDVSLAYAYNLNWSPRPIFQCFSVWTDKLDILNAQHFESNNAPEILLYSIGTIDGRYPPFDSPAAFRTILKNYKPVFTDGTYIILRKADTHNLSPSNTISVIDTQPGKLIPVPKTNGYLFAKIYMDYNLLGKAAKLFYKPPNATITFIINDNAYNCRFIFATARNGIFLSQKPTYKLKDVVDVWNGNFNNNMDAIVISAKNTRFYDKHIKVEFFEVPK